MSLMLKLLAVVTCQLQTAPLGIACGSYWVISL